MPHVSRRDRRFLRPKFDCPRILARYMQGRKGGMLQRGDDGDLVGGAAFKRAKGDPIGSRPFVSLLGNDGQQLISEAA